MEPPSSFSAEGYHRPGGLAYVSFLLRVIGPGNPERIERGFARLDVRLQLQPVPQHVGNIALTGRWPAGGLADDVVPLTRHRVRRVGLDDWLFLRLAKLH